MRDRENMKGTRRKKTEGIGGERKSKIEKDEGMESLCSLIVAES